MLILVVGGAGYVGSHVSAELLADGHEVIVLDNLCQGHWDAIPPDATFVEADLADRRALNDVFDAYPLDAVMHFAGHTLVGESMAQPFLYLRDNVVNGLNLMQAAVDHGVRRFVLSSTANLFDAPQAIPIAENERIVPGSPYGESKHILERCLYWLDRTRGLKYAALRYFNASGAIPPLGEDHDPETHLIPLVLRVALGQSPHITIYGDDYPTPDGTCIRDYVHVRDLARAHILSLMALDQGSRVYNLGSGQGYSVRAVIEMAREVSRQPIPAAYGRRPPGDPAVLLGGYEKIRRELGWEPVHSDLREIVASAWEWHSAHPHGYES